MAEEEEKSLPEKGAETAGKGFEKGGEALELAGTVTAQPELRMAGTAMKKGSGVLGWFVVAMFFISLLVVGLIVFFVVAAVEKASSGHFLGSPGAIAGSYIPGPSGEVVGATDRLRCRDDTVAKRDRYGSSQSAVEAQLVYIDFMGSRVRVHRLVAAQFELVIRDIRASGTTYNFYDVSTWRSWSQGNVNDPGEMSNHNFGLAIDINPKENENRRDNVLVTDLPQEVIDAFRRHGFTWGGDYRSIKDSMHFEYCVNR